MFGSLADALSRHLHVIRWDQLEEPAEFPRHLLDFLAAAELKVHTSG